MDLFGALVIVVISILTCVYAFYKRAFNYWKSKGVPYNEPSIPYGNGENFGTTTHPMIYYKALYDKFKPTGAKICGAYSMFRPILVPLDLEIVRHILIKDFANFNDRGGYYNEKDDPLSAHLFSLEGEKWKRLRAKLTPTFTSGKMRFMYPTIVEVGERFRECLFEVIKEHDELEMKDLCARFTTDIIGTCAFGIECNSLKDPEAEFRHYGRMIFGNPRYGPFIGGLIQSFKGIALKLHVKTQRDDISDFFLKAVRDTVEYREKNHISRNDFMDLLIKLKNQETTDKQKSITVNEIAAQAFVFFIAGFETSSTTLTFCLYELAKNPEVQTKAREAIETAFEKHNGQFTYEMMTDIPYIDQILHETLRMYPSLGILNRSAKNDYLIPGTDVVIPKGMAVAIPTYGIQYDPEFYPDPEKFDPDRFSHDEKMNRDTMTWLAFGDGPRNCIGSRFGMMQSRVGLVTLLKNFEFSLSSKTQIPPIIDPKSGVTQPKGGIYLKLKPIKERTDS